MQNMQSVVDSQLICASYFKNTIILKGLGKIVIPWPVGKLD